MGNMILQNRIEIKLNKGKVKVSIVSNVKKKVKLREVVKNRGQALLLLLTSLDIWCYFFNS